MEFRIAGVFAAILALSSTLAVRPDDVDSNGWCNVLVVRGGNLTAAPMFLHTGSSTAASWQDGTYTLEWNNDAKIFEFYRSPRVLLYYGLSLPGGDTSWHTGALPGGSRTRAVGQLPLPSVSCAPRFREEDHFHCTNIIVHSAGSTEVNRLYVRQTATPGHGVYRTDFAAAGQTFQIDVTPRRIPLVSISTLRYNVPWQMYSRSSGGPFPVSDVSMVGGGHGLRPEPRLSCVELEPMPTPPPLGGAGTLRLVAGRSAAGVAVANEFSYYSYAMPPTKVREVEVQVSALGGGSEQDAFWLVSVEQGARPTLEGFRWGGRTCVSIMANELARGDQVLFIGVYKFDGRRTPFMIKVTENPVSNSTCV